MDSIPHNVIIKKLFTEEKFHLVMHCKPYRLKWENYGCFLPPLETLGLSPPNQWELPLFLGGVYAGFRRPAMFLSIKNPWCSPIVQKPQGQYGNYYLIKMGSETGSSHSLVAPSTSGFTTT